MNCPKCNSPLKDGDKFCQVCGSVIEGGMAPSMQQVQAQPMQNQQMQQVQAQPMQNQPMQQMGNMGMPMPSQSMPQQVNQGINNYQQSYNPEPVYAEQPAKKNNIIVIIMGAIIVLLIVIIAIVLLMGNGSKSNTEDDGKGGGSNEPTAVDTNKYTKTTIGSYTFELPEGYSAKTYLTTFIACNEDDSVATYLEKNFAGYKLSQLDKEGTKAKYISLGMTDVTYTTETINKKTVLTYKGTYQGYIYEVGLVETSTGIDGFDATYLTNSDYTEEKDNVHHIWTTTTTSSSSYNIQSSSKFITDSSNSITFNQ